MPTKRALCKAAANGLGLVLIPACAMAVNVSSYDGNGEQHRTRTYSNGADVSGNLRSVNGQPVYYNGKVAKSGCTDDDIGRYTNNTTSKSFVGSGGLISSILGGCGFQGVKSKVCRDISAQPDVCGPDSTRY